MVTFRNDVFPIGGQTAVGGQGQLPELDHPARKRGKRLRGNFRLLHRFIEGDVTVEADAEKLKVGPAGGFQGPVEFRRIARIGKVDVLFPEAERGIQAPEQILRHILPVAERMGVRNRRGRLVHIFVQIVGVQKMQGNAVVVQLFREKFVKADHRVAGRKTEVETSTAPDPVGDGPVDLFRSQAAH